tara:strand:+ start:485 stop:661 length:177 start_codon:yes stop_codon:yes gene_type:complete
MKKAMSIIQILILFPIAFYTTWYILNKIDASELIFFLFWIKIPLLTIVSIINVVIEKD